MANKIFEILFTFSAANRMSAALNIMQKDITATGIAANSAAASLNRLRANMITAGVSLAAFGIGVVVMKDLYNSGQQVANAMARLRLQGIDNAGQAKIYQAAWQTALTVHGTLLSDNIALAQEAYSVFGDLNEAISSLPQMARIQQTLTMAGQPADNAAMLQLVKAADVLVGPGPQLNKVLDIFTRTMVASQGLITPSTIMQFVGRAGATARMQDILKSPDPFVKMSEAMVELGGGTIGSALYQFGRMNMSPTGMTKAQAMVLQRFGLIRPGGIVSGHVMPGALTGSDLALNDLPKWIQSVMIPQIAKTFHETPQQLQQNPAQLNQAIMLLFGTRIRTVSQLISELATQPARLQRQTMLFGMATGGTGGALIYENTNAMTLLKTSMDNLGQVLGQQEKTMVDKFIPPISNFVDRLSTLFVQHPTAARATVGGIGALTGMAGLIGIASLFKALGGYFTQIPALAALEPLGMFIARIASLPLAPLGVLVRFVQLIPEISTVADILPVIELAMGPAGWLVLGLTAAAGLAYFMYKTTQGIMQPTSTSYNAATGLVDTTTNRVVSVLGHNMRLGAWTSESLRTVPLSHIPSPQTVRSTAGGHHGFQHGTPYVPETGMYMLHKGEAVTPSNKNKPGVHIGAIHIHQQPGEDGEALARRVVQYITDRMQVSSWGSTIAGGMNESPYLHGST